MRRLVVYVAAVVLVAGCSEGQIEKTSGEVRIWLHESGFAIGGEDAIVAGTVTYDHTIRCMFLADGSHLHPVIWPSGARIEEENPVTLRVRGETIAEGDYVEGGGGYQRLDMFDGLIPTPCRGTDGDVATFNADSQIKVGLP